VRWQHPVRGQVPPGDFIGIAEQSDLIDKLGDWVLRRACADRKRLGTPTVGINVSVVQLRRADFAERFSDILMESATSGSHLVIEITESLPLKTGTVELRNIEALRGLGVRVAIDDFGTGFASLEYLRGFPFDIIKIDRSYVANLPASRIDGLIVSSIAKIARSLKVEVIAEGVETTEQLQFLQRAGVTALQGYLLARPEPLRSPRFASAA
jgi:EAL domain-containing protein (putative c-di-GMP-specific phosphodiesterase class I)